MTTFSSAIPGREVDRGLLTICVLSLIAGCASTRDTMQPVTPAGQAILVNYGSVMRPRCEDADMKVVNGEKEAVCQAYLQAIDGREMSRLAKETPAVPGTHSLSIHCEYAIIGPKDRGIVARLHTLMTTETKLDESKRYYLWAEIADGKCAVNVSDQMPPQPAPLWKAFLP
jgi:hypothetical protein